MASAALSFRLAALALLAVPLRTAAEALLAVDDLEVGETMLLQASAHTQTVMVEEAQFEATETAPSKMDPALCAAFAAGADSKSSDFFSGACTLKTGSAPELRRSPPRAPSTTIASPKLPQAAPDTVPEPSKAEYYTSSGAPAAGAGQEPPRSGASAAFALVLQVLIVLIVVDGFMRLRKGQAGQEREEGDLPKEQLRQQTSQDDGSWAELMRALLGGDLARCKVLLDSDVSLAGCDEWGCTLLHAVAQCSSSELVDQLLARGHDLDVNAQDACDETPLHIAARHGNGVVCERLLEHGASIDGTNAEGQTPLVVAAAAGHNEVCEALLDRGAGTAGLQEDRLPALLRKLLVRRIARGAGLLDDVDSDDGDNLYGEPDVALLGRRCGACSGMFFSSNLECYACGTLWSRDVAC
eukprot:TRINITY_DN9016_c0_g6_i1.p1 TRINITY_DN9016_c0_g6~~TRINITY_DN9016_c0_g6_i1.p1  ORF type:complete len:412 (+),score=119.18 TRINITY_DN9016_c0_g6_i1:171-1406(+)